jgi:hypothetical protein
MQLRAEVEGRSVSWSLPRLVKTYDTIDHFFFEILEAYESASLMKVLKDSLGRILGYLRLAKCYGERNQHREESNRVKSTCFQMGRIQGIRRVGDLRAGGGVEPGLIQKPRQMHWELFKKRWASRVNSGKTESMTSHPGTWPLNRLWCSTTARSAENLWVRYSGEGCGVWLRIRDATKDPEHAGYCCMPSHHTEGEEVSSWGLWDRLSMAGDLGCWALFLSWHQVSSGQGPSRAELTGMSRLALLKPHHQDKLYWQGSGGWGLFLLRPPGEADDRWRCSGFVIWSGSPYEQR